MASRESSRRELSFIDSEEELPEAAGYRQLSQQGLRDLEELQINRASMRRSVRHNTQTVNGHAEDEEVAVRAALEEVLSKDYLDRKKDMITGDVLTNCKIGDDSLQKVRDEYPWEEHIRAVGLSMCVYSFGKIDLSESQFHCDFGIKMVWLSELDEEGNPKSRPRYDVPNATNLVKFDKREHRLDDPIEEGSPLYLHNFFIRNAGEIRQLYDVRDFPFDVQVLCIKVRLIDAGWNPKKEDFVRLKYHELKVDCIQPDWIVYKPIRNYSEDPTGKAQLTFQIVIRRKWQYFVWNILVMQCMLTTVAFSSFGITPEDWGTRAEITMSLMVSTMALKWTIASSLPKVNYQTFIDVYMLVGFTTEIAILVCQGLPVFLRSHIVPLGTLSFASQIVIDIALFKLLAFLWLLFNVVMVVYAVRSVRKWHHHPLISKLHNDGIAFH